MKSKSTVKTVLRYVKRYIPLISASVLLSAVTVCASLYVPIVIGDAIDCIVGKGNVDFERIFILLRRVAVVIGFGAVAQWVSASLNNRITCNVVRDIRKEAFDKLTSLPLSYIDANPAGSLVSRVIADADTFADGLLMGFTQFFTGILTILGTLVFMFRINVKIAALVVVLTPLSVFAANFIAKRTYSMFKLQSETRGEQTSLIDEIIGNEKTVKAFSHERKAIEDFDEINERLEKCSLDATFFSSLVNPSTRMVNNFVYALVAMFGALSVISGGSMTVGMLSCLLSYSNQYTKPFNEISGVITELQNSLACAERVFELIGEESETPDSPDAAVLSHVRGEITLSHVSFSYDPTKKLLRDVNLKVKPGETVAIVGPTGCGKTTLINLLMRFYDVDSGEILADGLDIRNITRSSLRENYGMVLQETWLKAGTIRENIVMGKPDATDEQVLEASKKAHSYSFIRRLPEGFNTKIGEDGGLLSQGQKQLLCITRVMLSLPPMLILDEATSSIDTRTEVRIRKAFARMMEGRTSFIVAHRLSTIMNADTILVMKDGNIIEQGNHDSLIAQGGFYRELFNSQFAK